MFGVQAQGALLMNPCLCHELVSKSEFSSKGSSAAAQELIGLAGLRARGHVGFKCCICVANQQIGAFNLYPLQGGLDVLGPGGLKSQPLLGHWCSGAIN